MNAYGMIGIRLALIEATASSYELLRVASIRSVALRGPVLAKLLYRDDEIRTSIDVDLLVMNLEAASEVLVRSGYRRIVDWTPGMQRHAWTHVREAAVSVDIHQSLVGADAPPNVVWDVLNRESEPVELGGITLLAPSPAAHLTIVALHAAQHGKRHAKTIEDLRRAVLLFGRSEWSAAASIADELGALPAFVAGLSLVPAGTFLADVFGRQARPSEVELLRAGSAPATALGLQMFLKLRGSERRAFLIGKIFPPREFMRDWHPVGRRGSLGVTFAYFARLLRLAGALPSGIRTVLRARRRYER